MAEAIVLLNSFHALVLALRHCRTANGVVCAGVRWWRQVVGMGFPTVELLGKNINGEAHIHAKVDGKKVIISEATIMRDLKFKDEGGVDCLSNKVIFEQFPLIGGIISKTQFTATLNEPSSIEASSGSEPRHEETMGDAATQTRSERVSKFSDDPPLSRVNILESRKDRLELKELMELCIKLFDMVLDLEKTKTAQAKEIANLKKTEAKKEKEVKISWVKRLYKVGLSARVESSAEEESLGEGESSKQRRIEDIDANDNITLANDQEMFDADRDLQGEEVVTR
nr:hypothetical protein [Tanacetum cinerariifolium]